MRLYCAQLLLCTLSRRADMDKVRVCRPRAVDWTIAGVVAVHVFTGVLL